MGGFGRAICQATDALAKVGNVEIDEQAKPLVGQAQTGQKLLSVHRREDLDRLPILDNEVRAEPVSIRIVPKTTGIACCRVTCKPRLVSSCAITVS